MAVLTELLCALKTGAVEIVDLTNKLSEDTPSLTLPAQYPSSLPFVLEEIAAYDDRGPSWKAHNIHMGEHTGTHIDVAVHWVTGRDGVDVSEVALERLVAPAVVLDLTSEAAADADFLVEVDHVSAWEARYGAIPQGSWLLVRTGWSVHSRDEEKFTNKDENGSHTPGFSSSCAQWIAENPRISGVGVETLGIDAGQAHRLEPQKPMHYFLLGHDTYGITMLQNLDRLPPTGAVVIVAPLPIVGGTGSPARVLALVEHN